MNFRLLEIILTPLIVILAGAILSLEGNTSISGDLEMHATIESIGVVFEYSGDDDQDNQASIQYREAGDAVWMAGPNMMVARPAHEWRVSLVHLSPDTLYVIRVLFSDPDGVSIGTTVKEIKTRSESPSYGISKNIYYVPDDGDLQTLIEQVEPGDTIRLRSGVYHSELIIREGDSGEDGAFITIEAEPGGDAVLDGSDPDLNDQSADNWLPFSESIYFTDLSWADDSCSKRTLPGYVGEKIDGDSVRYLLYEGSSQWGDFLLAPPGSAFYDCEKRLYVKTYQEDDPDHHEMHVSRFRNGVVLAGADFLRIRNIEFRFYGDYGIYFANPGADNNVIEGNSFHGIGLYHIRIGQSSSPSSSDNMIQDNEFYENGFRDSGWTWNEQYRQAAVTGIRLLDAGPGNIIRRNNFMSGTDAISIVNQSHNTDVYENKIFDCMDDGIEVDNEPGQNIRVWANEIHYCFSGISNQDWFTGVYYESGPVYIFRNVIIGGNDPGERENSLGEIYHTAYAFKVGSDEDRPHDIYYYHNTVIIPDSFLNGNGIQDAGGLYFSGTIGRNNLFSTTRFVFNLRRMSTIRDHDFDCDGLYSSRLDSDKPFIQWSRHGGPEGNGSYNNLPDFQVATGQESNGSIGSGNAGRILFDDQVIDSGCIITGFNDRGKWQYLGSNPDIGAYEWVPYHHLINVNRLIRIPQ